MKKLARFTVLSILYVLLFTFFLCVIPALAWIFGGSFLAVIQSGYSLFAGLFIAVSLGLIFSECFDQNFYSKN